MTSTAVDGIRHLAHITTIEEVKECNNPADKIHAVRPEGTLWWVVAPKTMTEGDKGVYFEIDSILNTKHPAFEPIRGKKATRVINGHYIEGVVLRTMYLRETLSQGLILPISEFEGLSEDATQEEVDTYFDGIITKHVEEKILAGGDYGLEAFPNFIVKTDAERVQNIPTDFLDSITADDVYATEKIDGTSMTVWRDIDTGEIRIANRDRSIKVDAMDSKNWKQYADGYRRYAHVFDQLKPGEWVQGELFCDRIGGHFKFSTGDQPDFRAFHASNDNVEALFKDANLWVPILDIEWVGNGFAALEQADTVESQVAPGQTAEGIVWYFNDGKPRRELANRAHFKIVSNAFLTRGKRRK